MFKLFSKTSFFYPLFFTFTSLIFLTGAVAAPVTTGLRQLDSPVVVRNFRFDEVILQMQEPLTGATFEDLVEFKPVVGLKTSSEISLRGVPSLRLSVTESTKEFPKSQEVSVTQLSSSVTVQSKSQIVAPAVSIAKEASNTELETYRKNFSAATEGRAINRWYEISGRISSGSLNVLEAPSDGQLDPPPAKPSLAEFYTSYQRLPSGEFKIHHRGNTLEQVDVISSQKENNHLIAYRCGCWGYSEFNPLITLGQFGYRVALTSNGDLINVGYGNLFRKPIYYSLIDNKNHLFASIKFTYTGSDLSEARMTFNWKGLDIADATVSGKKTELRLFNVSTNEREAEVIGHLDLFLAMIPTQVIRGDGIRDSKLAQVETMIDWIRWARNPTQENLFDVISSVDALSSVSKVQKYLMVNFEDFYRAENPETPPPPVSCGEGGCSGV